MPEENLTTQESDFEAILARLRDEVDQGTGTPSAKIERPVRAAAAGGRAALGGQRRAAISPATRAIRATARVAVTPPEGRPPQAHALVRRAAGRRSAHIQQRRLKLARHAAWSAATRLCGAGTPVEPGSRRSCARRLELTVELDERLTRLERREADSLWLRVASAPAPPRLASLRPSPTTSPTRAACEALLRACGSGSGPTSRTFGRAAPVLDLGCGRGEFLGLLREVGLDARGVDLDA